MEKIFNETYGAGSAGCQSGILNEVKLYIMENMDKEDLTVDDIASRMCMSRTTFYNKWKLLTGEAPKYLISRIRMEKARELLESGKFSVTMVAEMVGMRNLKTSEAGIRSIWKTPKEFMKKYDIYLKKTFIERLSHIR